MMAYWFAIVATFILPAGLIIGAAIRQRKVMPVLLGILCFMVAQVFLRIPLLRYIATQTWYIEQMRAHPILVTACIALSAGLFEEVGRWIFMKQGKLNTLADGIAFGIGHGGIEAILLVGLNVVLLGTQPQLLAETSAVSFMQTGVERMSALLMHVSLTLLVWRGLRLHRKSWLFAVILLHGLVDFFAAYLQMMQVSIWTIEWVLCGMTLVLCAVSVSLLWKDKSKNRA